MSTENLQPAGDRKVKGFINSGMRVVGPGSNIMFGIKHALGSFENLMPLIDLCCDNYTLSANLPERLGGE